MNIRVAVILILVISLSDAVLGKSCEDFDYKVEDKDYDELLKQVNLATKKSFSKQDIRFLRYNIDACGNDLEYCCNVLQISGSLRTECTVVWHRSGRSISTSCSSSCSNSSRY